jgi:hypothetical protein
LPDLRIETAFYVSFSSGVSPPEKFGDFEDAQERWKNVHGKKHYIPGATVRASLIKETVIIEDCTPK